MKLIKLTQDKFTVVCDCHADLIIGYKWFYHSSDGYAARSEWHPATKAVKTVYMHNVIANTPKGMDTDHINRIRLFNTCDNLRTVTHKENMANRSPNGLNPHALHPEMLSLAERLGFVYTTTGSTKSKRKSGYRGVYIRPSGFEAMIVRSHRTISLGRFDNAVDAAKAYDAAALEYQGERARPNFGEDITYLQLPSMA